MILARIAAALAVFGLTGCGSTTSPSMPLVTSGTLAIARIASFHRRGLQPTIAVISPNVVSTAGTWGTITGTQFQAGATLNIGGAPVMALVRNSTTIQFPSSGAHAPGPVDVTVTNPGTRSVTVGGGYTYPPAESFDMNGEWIAHADARNDYTVDMRFTIRDKALVSLSCGTPVTIPPRCPRRTAASHLLAATGSRCRGRSSPRPHRPGRSTRPVAAPTDGGPTRRPTESGSGDTGDEESGALAVKMSPPSAARRTGEMG